MKDPFDENWREINDLSWINQLKEDIIFFKAMYKKNAFSENSDFIHTVNEILIWLSKDLKKEQESYELRKKEGYYASFTTA